MKLIIISLNDSVYEFLKKQLRFLCYVADHWGRMCLSTCMERTQMKWFSIATHLDYRLWMKSVCRKQFQQVDFFPLFRFCEFNKHNLTYTHINMYLHLVAKIAFYHGFVYSNQNLSNTVSCMKFMLSSKILNFLENNKITNKIFLIVILVF